MTMLAAEWYHPILATLFAFAALLLILIVLLQRGRGVGLSGAFGGAGGNTAFGSKTGDVLTWATIVVAGLFLFLAVTLNYAFRPTSAGLGASAANALPTSGAAPTQMPESTPPAPIDTDDSNAAATSQDMTEQVDLGLDETPVDEQPATPDDQPDPAPSGDTDE